ncbi:endo-1,4-beta-xylanase [Gracilimonas mengyeensis]|nr:endo-1,4-beta-xylanase [Gracilimonas mengyeensis]
MMLLSMVALFINAAGFQQTQAQIAEGKSKWLGSAYADDQEERFLNYWNQITPENSGKWGSVEGSRDQYNWTQLDEAYNRAIGNSLPFRFHVLVWGRQQPQWVRDLPQDEQLEELREWFEAVAERYPEIDYLEVVNEPINDPPTTTGANANDEGSGGYYEALGGSGETGWDWVINAFQMARDIFPSSVKLMINEYGIVSSSSRVQQYLGIVNLLKERGLIDGIGAQAHAFSNGGSSESSTSPNTMRNNLNTLGESGLPLQITELDIDGDPNGSDDESDELQLERYQRIFPVFWEHPKVEGVTLWGWLPGMWRSPQEAYIFNGRPRPAMEWLQDYVDTANVEVNVSLEEPGFELPRGYALHQNYPNPFNPSTEISYQLPVASSVSIVVYDLTGRKIKTLLNSQQSSGSHSVTFNANGMPTGVYFYEIKAGAFRQVKRMTLIK